MSEAISKEKVLEWLDVEIDLSNGSSETDKADRWAFRHVKREIERGTFDLSPTDDEYTIADLEQENRMQAERNARLQNELNEIRAEKARLQQKLKGYEGYKGVEEYYSAVYALRACKAENNRLQADFRQKNPQSIKGDDNHGTG